MTSTSEQSEDVIPSSFRAALPALFFLSFLFLLNFTSRVIFAPLLPLISGELGLTHADSGSFFLCISSGYFVSILLSGHVSARIDHKHTIAFSSVASGVMLFVISTCSSLLSLRFGLFGLGAAAGLYLPSGLATIIHLVPPAYMARGIAVHELAPNAAFVLTPLLCAVSLFFVSWRTGLEILAVVLVCMGVLFHIYGRASTGKGAIPKFTILKQVLKLPRFWLVTIMFSMAICSTLGIYAMLPLFLVSEHGMDVEHANTLVAFSRIGSVGMPLLGGWIGDKLGNQRVMGVVLLTTGVLTIPIGLSEGWLMIGLVVVQPMVAVCFFPSAFAVLSKIGATKDKNVVVSLCIPLAFLCGGGILPTIIGTIGDYSSLGAGITTAGGLMVLASICSPVLLKSKNC